MSTPTATVDVFKSIYDAPESWRHIGYVPITVKQLNAILARAEALKDDADDAPHYSEAKREFREQNEIAFGHWTPRKHKAPVSSKTKL